MSDIETFKKLLKAQLDNPMPFPLTSEESKELEDVLDMLDGFENAKSIKKIQVKET